MDDHAPQSWAGRLRALQAVLPGNRIDGLVVSTGLNITYLTGFSGSAGLLVVTPRAAILIADGRYDLAAREGIRERRIAPVEVERVDRRYDLTLGALLTRLGLARVGFESAQVTVSTAAAWQRAAPEVQWVALEKVVERQRMIKDAAEIEILRRGGRLLAEAARALPTILKSARTERDVAAGIEHALMHAGFQGLAFPTIVAAGPNSAHPHAKPGNRSLDRGDLVVLDFGGVIDGYCVDLTRMAAVEPVAPRQRALFEAVEAAHAAALRAVRPGVLTSVVDTAARGELDARGLGPAFSHSTGHGLGLEVHEAPRIGQPDPELDEPLRPGMVFTIEPGAYVEQVGGVRLEDDVLVTADGCEVLTVIPRDLLVI